MTDAEIKKRIKALETEIIDEKIKIRKMRKAGIDNAIIDARTHGLKSLEFALKLYKGLLKDK